MIYRFKVIPGIKITAGFLVYIKGLKFTCKGRDIRTARVILCGENIVGDLPQCNFKNYYKAAVIKAVQYKKKKKIYLE